MNQLPWPLGARTEEANVLSAAVDLATRTHTALCMKTEAVRMVGTTLCVVTAASRTEAAAFRPHTTIHNVSATFAGLSFEVGPSP